MSREMGLIENLCAESRDSELAENAVYQPVGSVHPRLIRSRSDAEAVALWLAEFEAALSPDTLRAYGKESKRLLFWAEQVRQVRFGEMTREDVLAYESFLANPPRSLCGNKTHRRHGENRHLFRGPLTPQSVDYSMRVANALFSYLQNAGYVAGNPFSLRKTERHKTEEGGTVERYFPAKVWSFLLEQMVHRPLEDRWLFFFAYHSAARPHELAKAKMGDLGPDEHGKLWWRVQGKGRKIARVPITDAVYPILERYRHSCCGLPPWPQSEGDVSSHPLIGDLRNPAKPVTANGLYYRIKRLFASLADEAENEDIRGHMLAATPYWLRHTKLSHLEQAGVRLTAIQRFARHARIDTTRIYQHTEMSDFHDSISHAVNQENISRPCQLRYLSPP